MALPMPLAEPVIKASIYFTPLCSLSPEGEREHINNSKLSFKYLKKKEILS
jgi:hypothetical protein